MEKRIVFLGQDQVAVESFTPATPVAGEVQVKVNCSLLSNGTESIVLHRRFAAGSHWDNWVKYPFYPGYAAVGEVAAVGEGVETLSVGDRVALRSQHASMLTAKANECFPIPASLSDEQAAWFALAKITAMGAKVADYSLGDSVLVIGAGPIGQMTVRWAAAAGVRHLIVVDMAADRLALAQAGGATCTISKGIDEAIPELTEACGGKLPGIVVDTTGNSAVFASSLAAVARFGKVVVMGDTGTPTSQHLTADLIMKGITVVAAHDTHDTPEWNSAMIVDLFYHLLARGAISVEGLATHRFAPDNACDAYKLAADRNAGAMGILFDWTV